MGNFDFCLITEVTIVGTADNIPLIHKVVWGERA